MASENAAVRKEIQSRSGWFFLAKDVADWTGISFYDVMERSAMEVLGTVRIMKDKIQLNQFNG